MTSTPTSIDLDTATADYLAETIGDDILLIDNALWTAVRDALTDEQADAIMTAYEAATGRSAVVLPFTVETSDGAPYQPGTSTREAN